VASDGRTTGKRFSISTPNIVTIPRTITFRTTQNKVLATRPAN
jgi:hypothetical protein